MEKPVITKEKVKPLLETGFLNVYDLQYREGKHYFNASRRKLADLAAVRTDEEYQKMLPDAVSCVVIVELPDQEPMLLLAYEYRYPTGRYLLGVPAGLIDPEDRDCPDPILTTAAREIREETGFIIGEGDTLEVISPLLFSTPGMTDESNALALAVIRRDNLDQMSQSGALGQELVAGFEMLTLDQARKVLAEGRDKYGNFYSMYTWAGLMVFCSGMWR